MKNKGEVIVRIRNELLVFFILATVTLVACEGSNNGNDQGSVQSKDQLPTYTSYGEWPQYEGGWKSLNDAAGSKFETWAYLDITINRDGTFSGTYQSYVYSYTWSMPTAWGPIPTPVYTPDGNLKAVAGAIDFTNFSGEVTFQDIGSTPFTLDIHSGDEVAMVFPSDFTYSVANIQR